MERNWILERNETNFSIVTILHDFPILSISLILGYSANTNRISKWISKQLLAKSWRRKAPALVVLNVDLGSRNSGWRIPRIPRREGKGDNLANFIPKMGPSTEGRRTKAASGKAPSSVRKKSGRVASTEACTLESEDVPHTATQPRVDACTRTRISVYRRDGGDDAAEKRERETHTARHTRRRIRREAREYFDSNPTFYSNSVPEGINIANVGKWLILREKIIFTNFQRLNLEKIRRTFAIERRD